MQLSPSDYAAPSLEDDTEPAAEVATGRTTAAAPAPAGKTPDLKKLVAFTAEHFGVDADVLAGMIMRESALRPDVISGQRKSTAGAVGIAQFMPGTAERYGIDPTDVTQSIIGMGAYLRDNLQKFNGDYDKAIAGYNWGENRKALESDAWRESAPQETREYVDFVREFAAQLKGRRETPQGVSTNNAGLTPQQIEARMAKPEEPGIGSVMADSVRRGVPALMQNFSATALGSNARSIQSLDAVESQLAAGKKPADFKGNEDPLGAAWMSPEQRLKLRAQLQSSATGNVASIAAAEATKADYPAPDVVGKIAGAKTFGEAMSEFMKDPVRAVAAVGPESFVQSAPGLIAGALVPGGAAMKGAMMGAGSGATDYGSQIVQGLQEAGVDLNNPDAIRAAASDAELMKSISQRAFAHATPVAALDGATGGAASKLVLPSKALAGKPVARELANVAVQMPAQGAAGMAGEAAGQVASGQELKPGEVFLEGIGELASAPGDLAALGGQAAVDRVRGARSGGVVSFTPADSDSAQAGLTPIVVPTAAFQAQAPQVEPTAKDKEVFDGVQSALAGLAGERGAPAEGADGAGLGDVRPVVDDRAGGDDNVDVPGSSAASGGSDLAAPGDGARGLEADAALTEELVTSWRGRRGGGYVNIMDAEQALPGVRKRHPDLDWRIERDADDAALQLNGYRKVAAQPEVATDIDARANEAATSPTNELPEPTEAQKQAGNYKVGRLTLNGLSISVENPRGSQRSGVDKDGSPWSVTMANHYGYIRGTKGADKDHVDVIVGPKPDSDKAFVVDQIHPSDGTFDEHKVVLGASDLEDAKAIYQANYAPGWKGMGGITEMPIAQFKVWVKAGAKTKPLTSLQGDKNAEVVRTPEGWGSVPAGVDRRNDVSSAGALPAAESSGAPAAPPEGLTEEDVRATLTAIQDVRLKRYSEAVRLTPMPAGSSVDTDAARSLAAVFGKPIIFAKLDKPAGSAGFGAVNTPKAFVVTDDAQDAHVALTMHEAVHAMPEDIRKSLIEALAPVLKRDAHKRDFPGYRAEIRDEEIVASLAQQHAKTPEFWGELAVKMGDSKFAQFAKGLLAKLDQIIGRFKDRDLTRYATDVQKVRDALTTAYAATLKRRGVSIDKDGTEFADVPRSSRGIVIDPDQFKQDYDLQPKTNSTRAIGEALNEHTIKTFGKIEDTDTSTQARDQIALAIADEVEYQLSAEAKGAKTGTGVGWYSKNYPKALTSLGKLYPELQKSKGARATFTALLAITSNGEKVGRNIAMARQLYETYRTGGDLMKAIPGTKRQQSLDQNVEAVVKLLEMYGQAGMAKVLLEEMRVGDINAELRKAGVQTNSAYPANMVMPRAALFFGPKLGAFYANLMGSQGYLTMDLWWSRSFNRMRGTLLPEPTDGAVAALREAFGEPEADVSRLIELARPYQEAYAAKGYKDGTSLEKRANTFMKAAALELNEAPARASDREFMAATAQKAQQLLRTKGIDLTIADVQAALWYYEKRLYGALGSRIVGDIGYLEAIRNAANEGDRSAGSPARGDREGSADDRGQAADVPAQDAAAEFSDNERSLAQQLRDRGGVRGGDATVALDSRPEPSSRGSDLRGLAADVKVDGELIHFGGFKPAQDAARAYARKAGIDYNPPRDYVTVDKERAGRIAQAFQDMAHAPADPEVKASYDAMIKETLAQYQAILDTGLKVEFITGDDPYRNPRNAILDVTMNNHLWVFPTTDGFGGPASSEVDISGNPLLAPTPHAISGRVALANDIFRVVHDYFGHIKEGVGFRADGEENAWRAHAAMYSPLARRAMTTETRGQNSWVNFGPHSATNKSAGPADTEYAPQKIGLLPEWVSEEGRGDTEFAENRSDWAWTSKEDTPDGPIYAGRNFAMVKPTRLAIDDFVEDDEVAMPIGHAAFVTEGNTPYGWQIVDRNGEPVGIIQAQVTPEGEIEAIHDIAIDRRGSGIGREIVAHIAAARRGDVRIIEALPQSQGFWDKVGAGYYDTNRNTTLDWKSFSRSSAGQAAAQAGREAAQPAGEIPAGEAGELSAEEVARLGIKFSDTPAFRRWFGDSKVVDTSGKPLVVYHGTANTFSKFDPKLSGRNYAWRGGGEGFFFTSNPETASVYAEQPARAYLNPAHPEKADFGTGTANIMPVYLRIERPLVVRTKHSPDKFFDTNHQSLLERAGRVDADGIIVRSSSDTFKRDLYLAFRPEQIKSAIGNNGDFSADDPRIDFAFNLEGIKKPDPKPATRATDGWILSRDELGNFRFGAGQKLYNVVAHIAGKVAARFDFKPMSPELKRAIRQMKLEVAKSQGKTAEVAKAMTAMSAEHREMISDIIEGELKAGVTPPKQVLEIAAQISALMSQQSDDLIAVGMLSKEAAEKWRDRYLPRFYESKLREKATAKWDAAVAALMRKPTVMKGIGGKSLKRRGMVEVIDVSDLPSYLAMGWTVDDPTYQAGVHTRVSVHRDFSREEREKMGEIRDSMFRFVMGYSRSQKDLALGRLYEHLADTIASRHQLDGYTQVPDTRIDGTDVSTYGKLAGLYVPNDVLSHLSQFGESEHEAVLKLYRKALGMWKEGKTVLNPVSHVNNVVSNLTMAHFGGVSYWDGHKYLATMKDFATNGKLLQQAREAGLFGGTVSEAELMNMMPKELQIIAKTTESRASKNVDFVYNAMSLFLRKPMGVAYNAEDLFFRHLLFREAKSRGLHDNDAVDYAQKYIFTYDDLPRGARFLRDTALPFFSYTYKVVPVLAHTALAHPWRYAAPWAVLTAINTVMYAIAAGEGEDEDWKDSIKRYVTDAKFRDEVRDKEKLERGNLPPWMKGSGFMLGTPKTIRLGMDDLTQLPVFLDVSRFFPGGDLLDAHTNTGGVPMLAPLTPSNPLLSTMGAMLWNRDPYFGKDVVDSNDTDGEAALKRGQWLWQQFAPAISVNNYVFNRSMNAVAQSTGKTIDWWPEDYTGIGKDGLPIQPKYAAMQNVGIKARPIDLDAAAQIDAGQRKKMVNEINAEIRKLRRLQAKGAISDEQAEVKAEEGRIKKDRLRQGLTVDGDERE